jgi:hypothetical protein
MVMSRNLANPLFWILELFGMLNLQIVHSMLSGGKGGLPIGLIGFILISRIPIFYVFGFENVFRIPPANLKEIVIMVFSFTLSWIIISLQSRKGGQFMIPN